MPEEKRRSALTMAGNIDRRTFVRFAVFDTFVRKKAWRNPVIFALILSAFAAVCFMGREGREQAVLLGSLLLSIGILLPLVWFGMFLSSARRQAKRSSLSKDHAQYYVTLLPEGINVEKGKENARFSWSDVYRVYRVKDCIYLYVSASRAFLLPEGENSDRAWEMICERLPEQQHRDRRH